MSSRCRGGKTSQFTAKPTATPRAICRTYAKENPSALESPSTSTNSAAMGIHSDAVPSRGSPPMRTPSPTTTATARAVGAATVVMAKAIPMPRTSPARLCSPCLAESATVGCMLTKAPSGA
ncbi:hypothetical protein D3C73_989200 [compost metagenome]